MYVHTYNQQLADVQINISLGWSIMYEAAFARSSARSEINRNLPANKQFTKNRTSRTSYWQGIRNDEMTKCVGGHIQQELVKKKWYQLADHSVGTEWHIFHPIMLRRRMWGVEEVSRDCDGPLAQFLHYFSFMLC